MFSQISKDISNAVILHSGDQYQHSFLLTMDEMTVCVDVASDVVLWVSLPTCTDILVKGF